MQQPHQQAAGTSRQRAQRERDRRPERERYRCDRAQQQVLDGVCAEQRGVVGGDPADERVPDDNQAGEPGRRPPRAPGVAAICEPAHAEQVQPGHRGDQEQRAGLG